MIISSNFSKNPNPKLLLENAVKLNSLDNILLIVPTNRKARSLKKDLIEKLPNFASSKINIETLATLSSKLLAQSKVFTEMSEAASTILIKQCADSVKLNYFSKFHNELPYGTLERIKNLFTEYKYHGISPNYLKEDCHKLAGSAKLKSLDIISLYEEYTGKCRQLNSFEVGDVYNELLNLDDDKIRAGFETVFEQVKTVLIEGFQTFNSPEIELLSILKKIDSLELYINIDYNKSNKKLFGHLENVIEKFDNNGFFLGEVAAKNQDSFREYLVNNFYMNKLKRKRKTNTINIIEATDEETEIELIAQEIKQLIVYESVEPSNICVVFNLIQNYAPIIRDIFHKYKIPFNLTDRILLANTVPITAIVSTLEILENDFYYKNVFRSLGSGFWETMNIDSHNLLRVSEQLKIVTGYQNWVNSIQNEISSLRFSNSNEDSPEIDKLEKAIIDIEKINNVVEPFKKPNTYDEFYKLLEELIVKLKIPIALLKSPFNQEKNIRSIGKFLETISEVFSLLEIQEGEKKKHSFSFMLEQLRTICSWARYNVKEKSNYGVQVTSFDEIKGFEYEYLFVPGLIDGQLPTKYSPEIFKTESFKKSAEMHQCEDRYKFFSAFMSFKKKIYISYPKTWEGRETVKSSFLNELDLIFEIDSVKPTTDILFDEEDYQIFIGSNFEKREQFNFEISNKPEIERSILIDKMRVGEIRTSSTYNGFLKQDNQELDTEVNELLRSFKEKQFSVTQLETYAKCPFKFYIERVLNIEELEEPSEDIEAIEMGRLLHEILFRFYEKIREKEILIAGCTQPIFSKALKIIFSVAEEEFDKINFKSTLSFFEKEKLMGLNGNPEDSILYKFVEKEREQDPTFVPSFFEVSFGKLKSDNSDKSLINNSAVDVNGVKLRGKIDRIDINHKLKTFNIIDYKLSGTKPKAVELKNGISLQLPIYMLAAQQLLKEKLNLDYSPGDMIIYSLKYSEDSFKPIVVSLKEKGERESVTVSQIIEISKNYIADYVNLISEGVFPLSMHENREELVCRYCNFRKICRVDEVNTTRN
ncbi:MAG: exodeoxyribonuclease V subunit gamma [Melioribacteraceae bacterium]|nr:exodeoxyribonuclease V subunit gamma [Melioribacteraceae bacterium]